MNEFFGTKDQTQVVFGFSFGSPGVFQCRLNNEKTIATKTMHCYTSTHLLSLSVVSLEARALAFMPEPTYDYIRQPLEDHGDNVLPDTLTYIPYIYSYAIAIASVC